MRLQAAILMTWDWRRARPGYWPVRGTHRSSRISTPRTSRSAGSAWKSATSGLTRWSPSLTYGVRMDLGYLGPGLRVVPSITYWSSRMKAREVGELESRLDSLIAQTQPGVSSDPVTFGLIDWSDLALALGHARGVARGVRIPHLRGRGSFHTRPETS